MTPDSVLLSKGGVSKCLFWYFLYFFLLKRCFRSLYLYLPTDGHLWSLPMPHSRSSSHAYNIVEIAIIPNKSQHNHILIRWKLIKQSIKHSYPNFMYWNWGYSHLISWWVQYMIDYSPISLKRNIPWSRRFIELLNTRQESFVR